MKKTLTLADAMAKALYEGVRLADAKLTATALSANSRATDVVYSALGVVSAIRTTDSIGAARALGSFTYAIAATAAHVASAATLATLAESLAAIRRSIIIMSRTK